MPRYIDADAFLERIQSLPKRYSDEEMRKSMWWFTHKFLPARLAEKPTVDIEILKGEDVQC